MTSLSALWMPIILSAVLVFVMSSILHMVLAWHRGDFKSVPNEDAVQDALRPFALPPGDYFLPRPSSMAGMKSPAFLEKLNKGPKIVMTVLPNGMSGMGTMLVNWFIYSAVVAFLAAYVAGRTLPAGTAYLKVFQIVGATAFGCYALGQWQQVIWYGKSTSTTIRATIDSLIYAMLTAGAFGWLWPH